MFQVSWTTPAKEKLRTIIESAPPDSRSKIIAAAHRIQARLIREGPTAGESRRGHFRVILELPLVAYVWVGEDEYLDTVTVIRILSRI